LFFAVTLITGFISISLIGACIAGFVATWFLVLFGFNSTRATLRTGRSDWLFIKTEGFEDFLPQA
jgi:TctA family transporter